MNAICRSINELMLFVEGRALLVTIHLKLATAGREGSRSGPISLFHWEVLRQLWRGAQLDPEPHSVPTGLPPLPSVFELILSSSK